ncbi:MAG: FAD-dependent oxidoreductase, partial [Elusimicrobiaceae bacterium]|nr:FAD-dependent oxidoreductase [Elusimicrobiaceae bacterium]
QVQRRTRHAWVYTGGYRVPFPFQANLYALPPQLRQTCVDGLLHAKQNSKNPPKNFEQWCLQAFGKGIYQTFMQPYNTKLWGRAPRELTCEWCGPFVPTPTLAEIRQSARRKPTKKFGYNASFYYPKQGGCGALVKALAGQISHLQTNSGVTQIDLTRKTVRTNGKIISFDFLVNTLPLPVFLRLLKNSPALTALASRMIVQPVSVYHIAFEGNPKPFSWIYCPDPQDPFYRVGLQSGFADGLAPKGCYSLYVELPGRVRPSLTQQRRIRYALIQKGIIRADQRELFSCWTAIPYAYAVYDKSRTPAVNQIIRALQKHDCFCAGRYGRWEYTFMETSLLQGKDIAENLYNRVV